MYQHRSKKRQEEPPPEPPIYHWVLNAWDEKVQAAIQMQRAFRKLKKQSNYVGWPSNENPYHWVHFVELRKKLGWTKEELYDEYGDARKRTDGGRARTSKLAHLKASSHQLTDAIGNFKQKYKRNPFGGHEDLLLEAQAQDMSVSRISEYLAARWWKARQEAVKQQLLKKPMKDTFKEGTLQHDKLIAWMLGNGHGHPLTIRNPLLQDLQASISFLKEDHQAKVMQLLGMFNSALQYKLGNKKERLNVSKAAMGMFDWAIKDTADEFTDELEESRRWCATPPEPPDGFEQDLYELHQQVCAGVAASTHRICRLRKNGRRWLQAFEDSTWKRRRLIRTRSAGNLGLLGPPSIDPSQAMTILPLVGEPPAETGPKGPMRHWVHSCLQKVIARQVRRQETGRQNRPLRCINTEWMSGVDWRLIEAKATGQPLPTGPRAPPAPTDEELNDLFEGMMAPDSEAKAPAEQGGDESTEKGSDESCSESNEGGEGKEAGRAKKKREEQEQPDHEVIPFQTQRYSEEVHDILSENGLTGLHCVGVLQKLMRALRTPLRLPPCSSSSLARSVDAVLRACPKPGPDMGHLNIEIQNEHAAVGSLGQDLALQHVLKEQGVDAPARSLSFILPNELGRAVEHAHANPYLIPAPSTRTLSQATSKAPPSPKNRQAGLTSKGTQSSVSSAPAAAAEGPHTEPDRFQIDVQTWRTKPNMTWDMLQRAWQQAGLPGWQGCDARAMHRALDTQNSFPGGSWANCSLLREQSEAFSCYQDGILAPDSPDDGNYAWPMPQNDRMRSAPGGDQYLGPAPVRDSLSGNEPNWASSRGGDPVRDSLSGNEPYWASSRVGAPVRDSFSGNEPYWASSRVGAPVRDSLSGNEQLNASEKGQEGADRAPDVSPSPSSTLGSPVLQPSSTSPTSPTVLDKAHLGAHLRQQQQMLTPSMQNEASFASQRTSASGTLSALAHGKALAQDRKRQILEKLKAEDLKRRMLAGLRLDNTDSSRSVYSSFFKDAKAKEDSNLPGGPIEQLLFNIQGDQNEEQDPPPGLELGALTARVYTAPTSDMLLLRRLEFWAVIVADAHVIQLFARRSPTKRQRKPVTWRTSLVRERRRKEERAMLEAYVEHFQDMQRVAGNRAVRIVPAEVASVTTEAHKHMQLDWCTLFKSEMYQWLNRYLTMGTLPPSKGPSIKPTSRFGSTQDENDQQQKLQQQLRPQPPLLKATPPSFNHSASLSRTSSPLAYRSTPSQNTQPQPPPGPNPSPHHHRKLLSYSSSFPTSQQSPQAQNSRPHMPSSFPHKDPAPASHAALLEPDTLLAACTVPAAVPGTDAGVACEGQASHAEGGTGVKGATEPEGSSQLTLLDEQPQHGSGGSVVGCSQQHQQLLGGDSLMPQLPTHALSSCSLLLSHKTNSHSTSNHDQLRPRSSAQSLGHSFQAASRAPSAHTHALPPQQQQQPPPRTVSRLSQRATTSQPPHTSGDQAPHTTAAHRLVPTKLSSDTGNQHKTSTPHTPLSTNVSTPSPPAALPSLQARPCPQSNARGTNRSSTVGSSIHQATATHAAAPHSPSFGSRTGSKMEGNKPRIAPKRMFSFDGGRDGRPAGFGDGSGWSSLPGHSAFPSFVPGRASYSGSGVRQGGVLSSLDMLGLSLSGTAVLRAAAGRSSSTSKLRQ